MGVYDPLSRLDEVPEALRLAGGGWDASIAPSRPLLTLGDLPENGFGVLDPLRELLSRRPERASTGPPHPGPPPPGGRETAPPLDPAPLPAALVAAWLGAALGRDAAGVAELAERTALAWLRDLVGLPRTWSCAAAPDVEGAHVACLRAALRWAGAEAPDVLASDLVDPDMVAVLELLGVPRDRIAPLDASALAGARPRRAIAIVTAGDHLAGRFDPIPELMDVAGDDVWVHVDGRLGLLGRVTPRVASLMTGIKGADSAVTSGAALHLPHPYGFAFLRRPDGGGQRPAPDAERAFSTWAALCAYGRNGYRELFERQLDLAARFAGQVGTSTDLERLCHGPLHLVCLAGPGDRGPDPPPRVRGADLSAIAWEGRPALRVAFDDWRATEADADAILQAIRGAAPAAGRERGLGSADHVS